MRITDDRYMEHRRCLDLAWRLIHHEARTKTISRWTQLSHHRIRLLYRSYAPEHDARLTRHRGVSPYRLDAIMQSTRLRFEGAIFGSICAALHVLPRQQINAPERLLPSLERGELLCNAFEWYQRDLPSAKLTIEQGVLILNELARAEQIQLATCSSCSGVMLLDRLSSRTAVCPLC